MLEKLDIVFEDVKYPFYWGVNCVGQIIDEILKMDVDRFVIVTDDTVNQIYGESFFHGLNKKHPTLVLSSPAGEKYKTSQTLMEYLDIALSWGVTRKSLIITLGGGIPGNIGGLLASLLFRGIRFIHIPTTVVGMFDSVLSLKQAINGSKAKNLIGVFSTPQAVFGDLNILKSLPKEHMRSGLCETIKNGLSISPEDLVPLRKHLVQMMQGDTDSIKEIFRMNVAAKLKVMANDKFEKNRGIVLEYGHTLGHAIEISIVRQNLPFSISHGEAVGIGMVAAARIAAKLGFLNPEAVSLHYEYLDIIGSPLNVPAELSSEHILNYMLFDNKRGHLHLREDEIAMVLLQDLGLPQGSLNRPLVPVSKEIVLEVIEALQVGANAVFC